MTRVALLCALAAVAGCDASPLPAIALTHRAMEIEAAARATPDDPPARGAEVSSRFHVTARGSAIAISASSAITARVEDGGAAVVSRIEVVARPAIAAECELAGDGAICEPAPVCLPGDLELTIRHRAEIAAPPGDQRAPSRSMISPATRWPAHIAPSR